MAYAAGHSKTVVLPSLIHCLLLLQLFVGVLCLVLVLVFNTLIPSRPSVAIALMGKKELVALL